MAGKEKLNHLLKGRLTWAVPLFALWLIGACTSYLWFTNGPEEDQPLLQDIKENYVAVLPFKNNTNQPEFAVIGEMASDWITSGLHETGEGKILSVGEVNRMIKSSNKQETTLYHSISENANVTYLIEGSYYVVKDSLMFSSHVKDLLNGEIVFSFPIIKGLSSEPLAAIEQLKQRILGYWMTKERAGYERKPPIYEAYKAYLEGGNIWYENPPRAMSLMKKATELDSNFHYAVFGYANKLVSHGQMAPVDSIIAKYQHKRGQLSRMELEFLCELQARVTRNYAQQWAHWNSPYSKAYWGKNFVIKQQLDDLLGHFNQPEMAFELLQEVDFGALDYQADPIAKPLYFKKINVLYRLGRYEEVTSMLTSLPFEANPHLMQKKLFALAKMKAFPELEQEIDQFLHTQTSLSYPTHYYRAFVLLAMLTTDDTERTEADGKAYLRFLETENHDMRPGPAGYDIAELLPEFYLALGEPEKARPLLDSILLQKDIKPQIYVLDAIYNVQTNNPEAARQVLMVLENTKKKYDYGRTEMLQAVIHTWLGEHDQAISLLQKARQEGQALWFYQYDGDWRLKALFDHPDFENKVMASLPVPKIEKETISASTPPTRWGSFLLLLLSGGGLVYFLIRKPASGVGPDSENNPSEVPGEKDHLPEDEFLIQLKNTLNSHLSEPNFGIPQFCQELGTSRAQFYRKVKERTDLSPSLYIRSLRLQKANELLQSSELNISEVAYEVGFKDLSYFSRSFSKAFGVAPSEARG